MNCPCSICGHECGNKGLLAMHMKSPGRKYRRAHRKFEKQKKIFPEFICDKVRENEMFPIREGIDYS